MMIEQHYDEEVLAEFLAEPRDAVSRDKHLASCELCLRSLDTLHATARTLKEPAVWGTPISTTPRPETLAFLRGVAKTMADEDATAAVWIKELLAGPREGWAARLAEHPEWRTGGMVKRLIADSEATVSKVPEDALAIADLAVQIADRNASAHGMRHFAGLSHYHRGYALWYTGKVMEALADFDQADQILSGFAGVDLDHARVSLMRAMVYQMLERRNEALSLASAAFEVFARYEDRDRVAAARSVAAITLQESHRHREALPIHAEIAGMKGISARWRITALNNMGLCYQAIGDFDQATENLLQAIAGYESLGMLTFRSKSRWALADVFAQQGKHEQALVLYNGIRTEFEELGMSNDVALASLDACEVLVALGRVAEVGDICRAAIQYFVANGLAQTEPALRGLSYLHEEAAAGHAIPNAIRGVRAFLEAPDVEPKWLFVDSHR
jgi:tetratricopeptide (TPR) repeat protein